MKMQSTGVTAVSEGIQANAFGFEVNAKMYSLMVDKLYQHKEAAVIRELSCNAYDSHLMNNNPEVPFDIKVPTWLDREFYIRDFGTGIPHEDFESIYTNVGSSTKSSSNVQIGSYGLGSKVPFALVETFAVDNFYDGTHTKWLCFKDEGFPQVSCLFKSESNEPSGLKVSFSIPDNKDHILNELIDSLSAQLRYFDTKPNVIGAEVDWETIPDSFKLNGYSFGSIDSSYWNKKREIVMASVAYPFDANGFDYRNMNNNAVKGLLSNSISIRASIGDVDVTPSRENLEMTDKSKDFILSKLIEIVNTYKEDTVELLESATSEFELRCIEATIQEELFNEDGLVVNTGMGEREYGKHWQQRNRTFQIETMVSYYKPARYGHKCLNHRYGVIEHTPSLKIYIHDFGTGGVKHYVNNVDKVHPESNDVILLKLNVGNSKAVVAKEAAKAKKELTDLGYPYVKLLSEVMGEVPKRPKKPRVTTVGGKRTTTDQIYKLQKSDMGSSNKIKNLGDAVEVPESGYYIVMKGSSIEITNRHDERVTGIPRTDLLDSYASLVELPIYIVREKSVPLVKDKLKDFDTLKSDALKLVRSIRSDFLRQNDILNVLYKIAYLNRFPQLLVNDKEAKALLKYRNILTVKANGYSRYRKSISCLLSYTIPKDREKDAAFLGKLNNKVEDVNLRHQALDNLITNSYNNLDPNKIYTLIKQYKDIVV